MRCTNFWPGIVIPFNPSLFKKITSKPKAEKSKKRPKILTIDWYAKALVYKRMLDKGVVGNKAELARKEGVSRARVTQILNLLNLAPEIQNYLMTTTDRKNLRFLTERRLRTIASLANHDEQVQQFRELIIVNRKNV
jgi:hypothetical protein